MRNIFHIIEIEQFVHTTHTHLHTHLHTHAHTLANSPIAVFIVFPSPLFLQFFHAHISPISFLICLPRLSTHFSIVLPSPYKSYLLPYMSSIYLSYTCSFYCPYLLVFNQVFSLLLLTMTLAGVETNEMKFLYRILEFHLVCVAYLECLQLNNLDLPPLMIN